MDWHKKISYIKSSLRLVGCAFLVLAALPFPIAMLFAGVLFGVAEVLGILEEL